MANNSFIIKIGQIKTMKKTVKKTMKIELNIYEKKLLLPLRNVAKNKIKKIIFQIMFLLD